MVVVVESVAVVVVVVEELEAEVVADVVEVAPPKFMPIPTLGNPMVL